MIVNMWSVSETSVWKTGCIRINRIGDVLGRGAVVYAVLAAMFLPIAAQPADGAHAEAAARSEHEVKAAFLFNFAKFIEWPDDVFEKTDSPIVVGILGDESFARVVERTCAEKEVHGRPFSVKRFDKADQIGLCHALFISGSEKKRLTRVFATLGDSAVLTVGEMPGFAHEGGMINFTMKKNKVHFEINESAARRAGLKISSKLLKLATIVEENGNGSS